MTHLSVYVSYMCMAHRSFKLKKTGESECNKEQIQQIIRYSKRFRRQATASANIIIKEITRCSQKKKKFEVFYEDNVTTTTTATFNWYRWTEVTAPSKQTTTSYEQNKKADQERELVCTN